MNEVKQLWQIWDLFMELLVFTSWQAFWSCCSQVCSCVCYLSPRSLIFIGSHHISGTLGTTLGRHRLKPRVYIGCMKSGPVLAQKWVSPLINYISSCSTILAFCSLPQLFINRGVRYHEPEYWKFGEEGNKYFRHATGQLYAISRDLATYISINQ